MAFDAYLKLENSTAGLEAKGESQSSQYEGWIELSSFDFGVETQVTTGSSTAGAGAGRAQFKELSITKLVDAATPALFMTCAAGGHFATGSLVLVRIGGATAKSPAPFLVYDFKRVAVQSVEWDGSSGDDVPRETVGLLFGAMQLTYNRQDHTGMSKPGTPVAWSVTQNKAEFNV